MPNEALYEWLKNGDMALHNADLLREAAASVRLDKGERGQTFTADDLGTHWDGCEAVHEECAAAKREAAGETTGEVPQPTEAQVQQAVIDALLLDGWLILRLNGGAMKVDGRYVAFGIWHYRGQTESAGISDLICTKGGEVLYVECKRPDKTSKQRPAQVRFMDAVEDSGCTYVLARSVDDIAPYLSRVVPQ